MCSYFEQLVDQRQDGECRQKLYFLQQELHKLDIEEMEFR